MSRVQLGFFRVAALLVAMGLGLSACRAIVEPPPLPRGIVPVLVPALRQAQGADGIDE